MRHGFGFGPTRSFAHLIDGQFGLLNNPQFTNGLDEWTVQGTGDPGSVSVLDGRLLIEDEGSGNSYDVYNSYEMVSGDYSITYDIEWELTSGSGGVQLYRFKSGFPLVLIGSFSTSGLTGSDMPSVASFNVPDDSWKIYSRWSGLVGSGDKIYLDNFLLQNV